MSVLLLSDDDVALLRWTCELFFVPESPLFRIDAEAREPRDFAATYQELIRKGALDDANFRLTDTALNRMAPLTECDARVVITFPGERGARPRVKDHYLLDEIAVEYEWADNLHGVGQDQDQAELVASLVKRFAPRKASGDYLNFKLTPQEFVVFAVLSHRARRNAGPVGRDALLQDVRPALQQATPEGLGSTRRRGRDGAMEDAAAVRHRAAQLMAQAPQDANPAHELTARAPHPAGSAPEPATAVMRPRSAATARLPGMPVAAAMSPPAMPGSMMPGAAMPGAGLSPAGNHGSDDVETAVGLKPTRRTTGPMLRAAAVEIPADRDDGPDAADAALAGLIQKGIALQGSRGIELRPSVHAMAQNLSDKQRCTVVRFDFSDDEWFIRETSFLSTDGSLFSLTTDDSGLLWVMELDQRRLETALARAVGPLPEAEEMGQKSAKDFLLRA